VYLSCTVSQILSVISHTSFGSNLCRAYVSTHRYQSAHQMWRDHLHPVPLHRTGSAPRSVTLSISTATHVPAYHGPSKLSRTCRDLVDPSGVEFPRRTASNLHGVEVVEWPVSSPSNVCCAARRSRISVVFRRNQWKKSSNSNFTCFTHDNIPRW